MKLEFDGIRFRNLLSTGEAWNVIPLNNENLTIIVGKNGCGKSTIIDAIVFGLFGKPFRKVKKGQLVNSINRKNCMVEIAFRRGSDRYLIKRGIKPNVFEIYKNKELIPEDSLVGTYQSMLENEIIGCSYKTFCQINILGKSGYTPYMQLEPKDRRIVVDELLESGIYTTMRELGAAELKVLKRDLDEINGSIQVLKEKIIGQERLINRQSLDKEEQLTAKKQTISNAEQRLKVMEDELTEAETQYSTVKKELDDLGVDVNKVTDMYYDIKSSISSAEKSISDARVKMKRVLADDFCPSCLQKIDENHKTHIEKDGNDEIQRNEVECKKLEKRLQKISKVRDQISSVEENISAAKNRVNSLKIKIRTQQDTIGNYEVELQDMLDRKDVQNTGDLEELENLNVELGKIVDQYDSKADEVDVTKRALEHLGDDGIKAALIQKYVPRINELINQYLDNMNLFVQFELDTEFNETIRSRYRDDYTYESFSEGEKLRIDLAIMLTWRQIALQRNSSPTNLLIMDEIFDGSMDYSGIYDVVQVLKSMNDTKNVYIITHRSVVSDELADNVITAEKIGNYTSYFT